MRVQTDRTEIAMAVRRMAEVISMGGGTTSDDFTVQEAAGHFWVTVTSSAGTMLVDYPLNLRPRMSALTWRSSPDDLIVEDGLSALSAPQAALVEAWLVIINGTDKLAWTRARVPMFAVTDWKLRHHLANAGYPALRDPPKIGTLQDIVIGWHASGGGRRQKSHMRELAPRLSSGNPRDPESVTPEPRPWYLIPLKCFVNHHPQGANQNPVPGRVAVAAATPTPTNETFENYGDLDAMQLLMNFGYLDDTAPLVHSVPVEVESRHLGRVVVRWRAPRSPRRASIARDVPTLRPTETGMELRHLTVRPRTRSSVASFLAMAVKARSGAADEIARIEAENLIDALLQANLEYYRRLDELVVAAMATPPPPIVDGFGTQDILPTIASMSLLQQDRLNSMWG